MIPAIIIEDEPKASASLIHLLGKYCPDVMVCGTGKNFTEGYRLVNKHKPRLLFADIQLNSEEGTGIDLVNLLNLKDTSVIFTSAWKNYAVDAFRVRAVDYLLKPINIKQLVEAVERVRKIIPVSHEPGPGSNRLAIPTMSEIIFIRIEDIVYMAGDGNYTAIHIAGKPAMLSSKNIGHYEELLEERHFFRIHHSYLVNMKKIVRFTRGKTGYVELEDGTSLEVSKRKKDLFMQALNLA